MPLPVPPIGAEGAFQVSGPEWQITPPVPEAGTVAPSGGQGFGSMLADQVGKLAELQTDAAEQSTALATGQATDVASVTMAVERARLAMQLASQVRGKLVEAYNDVWHTQV